MVIRCPCCGAENPDGVQYCNLCMATFGFESPEYGSAVPKDEGYLAQYPSSFNGDYVPTPGEAGPAPQADPVDIGVYGQVSGMQVTGGPQDYRSYGYGAQAYPQRASTFPWGNAVKRALTASLIAAGFSLGLEVLLGLVGLGVALGGSFTAARIWWMLALLIPCVIAGFAPGYWLQEWGWAVGIASVALWYFAFRPVYSAILAWALGASFHITAPFDRYGIVFALCLFLPLGALCGWLGEKRATTGLRI